MKRSLLFIITGTLLLWNSSSQAVGELGEGGGNNSNPHNLSSLSPGSKAVQASDTQTNPGKETQICIFCHTPHGATPQSTLWGRPDPIGMGSFPIRANLLIDDDPAIVDVTRYSDSYSASSDYPNGTSKLCLSCHDGVTAIGILAGDDSIDMTISDLSGRASQIDLTTSHPISFVYNSTVETYLGDSSYNVPSVGSGYLDGDSRVQCTSCHQPHQDTRAGGTNLPFWRYGNGVPATDYDPVCQACHVGTPSVTDEHNF